MSARVTVPTTASKCPSCEGRDWMVYGWDTSPKGEREVLYCRICSQRADTEWSAPWKGSDEQAAYDKWLAEQDNKR